MNINIRQTKLLSGHGSSVYALKKINNEIFLSAGGEGWIVEWEPGKSEDGQLLSKVDAQLFSLAYRPAEHQVWAGDMNGGVYVISRPEKELIFKKHHHPGGTYFLHSVGDEIISGGNDGILSIWSPRDLYPKESLKISGQRIRAFAQHPKEPIIAVGGSAGEIYILHTDGWKWIQTIRSAHERTIFTLTFSPDGNFLYSGAMDAHIKKWNWREEVLEMSIAAHRFTVNQLVILDQQGLLISASRDNSIKLWDMESLDLMKVVDSTKQHYHLNSVNTLISFNGAGEIISGSDDRSIRLWQLIEEDEN